MPGFNQKGPMNEGAMTGRGLGRCNANQNVSGAQAGMGQGQGFGQGRGQGRGMGRGRGQGNWASAANTGATPVSQQVQPTEDDALKLKVQQLESELAAIKSQMTQVDD